MHYLSLAQASYSFKCFDTCTFMYATPTVRTEAICLVTQEQLLLTTMLLWINALYKLLLDSTHISAKTLPPIHDNDYNYYNSCITSLPNCMGSLLCHIMPLVTNNLRGGHTHMQTHTHAHTHTDVCTEINLRNQERQPVAVECLVLKQYYYIVFTVFDNCNCNW